MLAHICKGMVQNKNYREAEAGPCEFTLSVSKNGLFIIQWPNLAKYHTIRYCPYCGKSSKELIKEYDKKKLLTDHYVFRNGKCQLMKL